MSLNPEISIVVPVFNEEAVIETSFKHLASLLDQQRISYELIFVDDGSQDATFEILKQCQKRKADSVRLVKFARNFGHQLAITAGLRKAQGKAVVVTDADLQDPPEVILDFIKKWREGDRKSVV